MRVAVSRRFVFLLAACALLALSVPWIVRSFSGSLPGTDSIADVVEPSAPKNREPAAERRTGELTPAAAKLLFALAHRTADDTNAGDLFASKSWYVPPPPPPPAPVAAPAPPSAPPLPYTFVGSYTEGNQATVYFLTAGDRVYDVKPGDTLDQLYSVESVSNGVMTFNYKPLNIRQTLAVGATP